MSHCGHSLDTLKYGLGHSETFYTIIQINVKLNPINVFFFYIYLEH